MRDSLGTNACDPPFVVKSVPRPTVYGTCMLVVSMDVLPRASVPVVVVRKIDP